MKPHNKVLELTPGNIAVITRAFMAGAVQHKRYRIKSVSIDLCLFPLCHAEEANCYRGICAGCADERL